MPATATSPLPRSPAGKPTVMASGASETATTPSASRCAICLNRYSLASAIQYLPCEHCLCSVCLPQLWTRNIEIGSETFQVCPIPGFSARASDSLVANTIPDDTPAPATAARKSAYSCRWAFRYLSSYSAHWRSKTAVV